MKLQWKSKLQSTVMTGVFAALLAVLSQISIPLPTGIPITLQTLMLNAVSFGDTLMLGLVSQESLAAVSLASQVSFVMSLFISTLTGGATVLSAQYIGKKDMDTVEGVLALILRGCRCCHTSPRSR